MNNNDNLKFFYLENCFNSNNEMGTFKKKLRDFIISL